VKAWRGAAIALMVVGGCIAAVIVPVVLGVLVHSAVELFLTGWGFVK
jgi:hypothetical protein